MRHSTLQNMNFASPMSHLSIFKLKLGIRKCISFSVFLLAVSHSFPYLAQNILNFLKSLRNQSFMYTLVYVLSRYFFFRYNSMSCIEVMFRKLNYFILALDRAEKKNMYLKRLQLCADNFSPSMKPVSKLKNTTISEI